MLFKRFGESKERKPLNQWYELADGRRWTCDEQTINTLWCNWVVGENSNRADTEQFTVFEFKEPVEIDLLTAEYW